MSVVLQKTCDEIHCDLLKREGALFCSDAVEGHSFLMGHDFVLLAYCTPFYVVCDPLSHSVHGKISVAFRIVSSRPGCPAVG